MACIYDIITVRVHLSIRNCTETVIHLKIDIKNWIRSPDYWYGFVVHWWLIKIISKVVDKSCMLIAFQSRITLIAIIT